MTMPFGIINLDKPAGISSARAVSRVKRLLPRGVKIGHAGTLDPFATGILLLLVGKATKLCEELMDSAKRYEAVIKLGAGTATDDPESPELAVAGVEPCGRQAVADALTTFVGNISQRPPAFSAMKVNGRRAYDLARKGNAVEMQPRIVRVDSIEMIDYQWPFVKVRIDCGRGTYIRSIARDLGAALGVGGHLTQLRRTRSGRFTIAESVTLEALAEQGISRHLLDPTTARPHMTDRSFIDEYEKGAARTTLAIAGLTREDLLAFPVPGTWSIQRLVIHLADAEQVLADRIKRLIAEDSPTLLAFDQDRWMTHLHYDEQSAEDACALIELTRKQLARVLKKLPDGAFDRTGKHSEAGVMSLRQVVEKASAHLNHHLKFVADKRESLGKSMW
ncbi:MAG TPA: tRNA pseudouridine(55) synthase TruB [Tepidisphaeraceae bacterium]|nr:tRNA pseudouridine(55) synthase TruB [Tepidisphaeraceae bacterium]